MLDKLTKSTLRALATFGPNLQWPLAIMTLILMISAPIVVTSVWASLGDGQSRSIWYSIALALIFIGLTWWHARNLDENVFSPNLVFVFAHIGATALTLVCGLVVIMPVILIAGLIVGSIIELLFGSAGGAGGAISGLLTVFTIPLLYFPGQLAADFLLDRWPQKNSQKDDLYSDHQAFEDELFVPFCLSAVPAAIVLVAFSLIYNYATLPSPAVARCMASAQQAYSPASDRIPNEEDVLNAIKWYDEAIKLSPKHATAYFSRGRAYKELGNVELAVADFEKAAELEPNPYRRIVNECLNESDAPVR